MALRHKTEALEDIDEVLAHALESGGTDAVARVYTLTKACIERWAPSGSSYIRMANEVELPGARHGYFREDVRIRAVLLALRRDYEKDRLATIEELVHSAFVGNLLEQSAHLAENGYLLPATVVAGAALEECLRELSLQLDIDLENQASDGKARRKQASAINDELKAARAYSQPEWRQIQAWLDLRNEAAHGRSEFASRTSQEVLSMLQGIRDFIARHARGTTS